MCSYSRATRGNINGYARMILKKQGDKFDEDILKKFNDIRLNARPMGKLIDDLLAFSRLGRRDISESELNMVDQRRYVSQKKNSNKITVIHFDLKAPLCLGPRAFSVV